MKTKKNAETSILSSEEVAIARCEWDYILLIAGIEIVILGICIFLTAVFSSSNDIYGGGFNSIKGLIYTSLVSLFVSVALVVYNVNKQIIKTNDRFIIKTMFSTKEIYFSVLTKRSQAGDNVWYDAKNYYLPYKSSYCKVNIAHSLKAYCIIEETLRDLNIVTKGFA